MVSVIEQSLAADPARNSHDVAVVVSQNGFPGEAIEFTFSRTAVGLVADTVEISALWAGECIIAQFGPAMKGVHAVVLPALVQGGCLVGSQVQRL